ncbi:hypothetical protein ACN47E_003377 [Coniothyrium glycines]
MLLALDAGRSAITWIHSLIFSFLVATNDIAWYMTNGDSVHSLMSSVNCTSRTLHCIQQAKAAAIAHFQAKNDAYWGDIRKKRAELDRTRLEKEQRNRDLAEVVDKASKFDELMRNPPVTTTTIVNHITNNNYITNNNLFVAQATEAPDYPAIAQRVVNHPLFNDDPHHLSFFRAVVLFVAITLFCAVMCWFYKCLRRCLQRKLRFARRKDVIVATANPHQRGHAQGSIHARRPNNSDDRLKSSSATPDYNSSLFNKSTEPTTQ